MVLLTLPFPRREDMGWVGWQGRSGEYIILLSQQLRGVGDQAQSTRILIGLGVGALMKRSSRGRFSWHGGSSRAGALLMPYAADYNKIDSDGDPEIDTAAGIVRGGEDDG